MLAVADRRQLIQLSRTPEHILLLRVLQGLSVVPVLRVVLHLGRLTVRVPIRVLLRVILVLLPGALAVLLLVDGAGDGFVDLHLFLSLKFSVELDLVRVHN